MENTTVDKAVKIYLDRKNRISHPNGDFTAQSRNNSSWYPDDNERRDCCKRIRTPSRSHPYSLMSHCRTIVHVAQLCDVDEKLLRMKIKEIKG